MKDKIFFIISFFLVAIDQFTKAFFINKHVGNSFISISYHQNSGSAFSLFSTVPYYNIIIIIFSAVALYILYTEHLFFFKNHIELIPLLIVSGIIGNLIDRMGLTFVRDFISLKGFFIFNLADTYLFLGVIIYLTYEIRNYLYKTKKN